ncbi:MAG TPA: family 1 glycosylhydrolase [Candidatus Saccharimonadales bacterium]|nr:family 1 glycosylhydrolase [Candidatus Saccharimonadales bacterium]
MPEDTKPLFPADFMWGASTSAHQVEGGNHDQWTVWELAHAAELAKTAERRLSHLPSWPKIKKQMQDPETYISGKGVDHYGQYARDFEILKKLNLNSFRFGIEWARIEPQEGQWDEAEVDHYRQYIKKLKELGIEPVMNIWHWTLPVWFYEKGGFKYRRNLKYFDRFVQKIAADFATDLKWIITINEPNVYVTFSYLMPEPTSSRWPPGEKSFLSFCRVYWNLMLAHRRAYKILKSTNPQANIGLAAQLANIQAKRPHSFFDERSTQIMRYFWNWLFLRRVRRQMDFVGFNYYFTDYYTELGKKKDPAVPLSDMGWYMEPEGLYPLLLSISRHFKGKPIIITENGVSDGKDEFRRWWLEESIVAMERALSEGVDLRGYFYWSLLDNFEWENGWWPKFGLVEVDRAHGMKRTVRPSAHWLAEKIKELSKK